MGNHKTFKNLIVKTNTKILIGASVALFVTGGVILSLNIAKKRKAKNECENSGGNWDSKAKECISDEGNVIVLEEQTKNDIGKTVNIHPTLNYTNVRSSANVDDGALGSWFGVRLTDGNFIGKVTKNPLGVITQAVVGDDEYNWYKIKLNTPLEGKTSGYVREDAISFK